MAHKYADHFYVDKNMAVRWKSNDNIPFDDMLVEFLNENLITIEERRASNTIREIETIKKIQEYKKQMENYEYSAEEMFEMRAAFGEGTKVVNIFTGKKVRV